jgi:restriction system protein
VAIPDIQSCMLPLAGDEQEHTLAEVREILAAHFHLSAEDRTEHLSNGQRRFDNRVSWAKIRLEKAGLLRSLHGIFQITEQGRAVLAGAPWPTDPPPPEPDSKETGDLTVRGLQGDEAPEEVLERAYQHIRAALAAELLDLVKTGSPHFSSVW